MSATSTAGGPPRERILNAAEELFFNRGIAVTGVDDVARAAGVAIATLYKHAGSKDRLLAAVLTRRLEGWLECWDAAIERAPSAPDRVLAVFDAVDDFRAQAQPTQWCCFLSTRSERPAEVAASDEASELIARDSAVLHARLLEQVEALGVTEPESVVADLVVLYNGVLASLLRGAPDDASRRARALAQARLTSAR